MLSPRLTRGFAVRAEPLRFRPAGTLAGPIREAFERERAKIRTLLPTADVLHTGATSLAGALTRGDLDVHVRVDGGEFGDAQHALATQYLPYRREMWTAEFAAFVAEHAAIATGIALTARGGAHDRRFVGAWERLRRDPALLDQLNALKLEHERARDSSAYEAAKARFFGALAAADGERAGRA